MPTPTKIGMQSNLLGSFKPMALTLLASMLMHNMKIQRLGGGTKDSMMKGLIPKSLEQPTATLSGKKRGIGGEVWSNPSSV
eukprot:12178054-Karenia_brevis.AAC.1